ncbi:MAG: SIMPL domain-containing protein [Bacillota bacterium]|nr:SIMPL domain-containing protein [Bacillota bacterium]
MKRSTKWGLAVIGILALAGAILITSSGLGRRAAVSAEEPEGVERTITVSGSGQAEIKPDQAVIDVGVSTLNLEAGKASEENATTMQAVIDAVKGAGIPEDAIRTSNYQISSEYNYYGDEPTFKGYRVINQISITLSDIDLVAQVLDAAVDAGANKVDGIYFGVTNQNEIYKQALDAAVQDATAKAQTLAASSGIAASLRPKTVVEVSYSPWPMATSETMAAAAREYDASTPIMASGMTVTATVNVTFDYVLD